MSNPSSSKCNVVIEWLVPRPSFVHCRLTCCVVWPMPSTHLQLQHNPTSNKDQPQSSTSTAIQRNSIQHLCQLPLPFKKMLTFFSLWFVYGGYKIGPSRTNPSYEQIVARMYTTIYFKLKSTPTPYNKSQIKGPM